MRKAVYWMFAAALGASSASGASGAFAEEAAPGLLDLDADGTVTFEEFRQFRRERALGNDADGDGVLSLDEFRGMLPSRVPRMMHGRAFGRVDANDDGFVDMDELDAMPARAFDRADADGDGQLTGEERERLADAL